MSQRQVNLKSTDRAAIAVQNVQGVTQGSLQAVKRIGIEQMKLREKSEKAILLGSAKSEELSKYYSKQLESAPAQMQAALTSYVREQATILGDLFTNSTKPGATKEDRDKYTAALTQANFNLNSLATFSVQNGAEQNISAIHSSAVAKNSTVGRITRDALNNVKNMENQNVFGSGQYENLKIENINGQVHLKAYNEELGEVDVNAAAYNNSLQRTGQTTSGEVITKEEVINETESEYAKRLYGILEEIPGLFKGVEKFTSKFDGDTNTKSQVKIVGATNIYKTLTDENNFKILLGETNRDGFNKTWDQLEINKYLEKSKYKDISWRTFNSNDPKTALENLNKNYSKYEVVDPTPGDKITEADFLAIQKGMKEDAARGLAQLQEDLYGNTVETVVSEKEFQNHYKNNDGTWTTTGARSYAEDYETYKEATPDVNATYNNFGDVVARIKANPSKFGGKKNVKTGEEVVTMIKTKLAGQGSGADGVVTKEDIDFYVGSISPEALYSWDGGNNPDDAKKLKVLTRPEYFDFANGRLHTQGRNTMYNLMGVDDAHQAVYTNDSEMKAIRKKTGRTDIIVIDQPTPVIE